MRHLFILDYYIMTNNTNQSPLVRTLAIAGFVLIIILLVWVAVRLVAVLPTAFSSLASIASSVYNERPQSEIVVANANSIINNGESFVLKWTNLNRAGVYTFGYECTDGVVLDMRFPANQVTAIPCDETIKLGTDVTQLEIMARSEMRRFVDIPYTIGFMENDSTELSYATPSTFTIVNVLIPQSQSITNEVTPPTGEVAGETVTEPEMEIVETPPAPPVAPAPVAPQIIATEIFELPSSNPAGFVDLAVTYLGVGRLTENNQFISGGTIDNDTRGAFQFEVRNLGTKTSDDWTFDATLTSGTVYESNEQDGLLPNERSIVTIGFDTVGDLGAQRFGAEIDVDNDNNSRNDSFSWAVNVTE